MIQFVVIYMSFAIDGAVLANHITVFSCEYFAIVTECTLYVVTLIFTARCYVSTVYAMALCLSVCHKSLVLLKWLKIARCVAQSLGDS